MLSSPSHLTPGPFAAIFADGIPDPRPPRSRPGAIALRCIKTVWPCFFGQVYLGTPWTLRHDDTGTIETFMVFVDGRAVRMGAELFEPVNPRHRRRFLHMLTEPEAVSNRRWIADLRDKCRGEAEMRDLIKSGKLVAGTAIPPGRAFRQRRRPS